MAIDKATDKIFYFQKKKKHKLKYKTLMKKTERRNLNNYIQYTIYYTVFSTPPSHKPCGLVRGGGVHYRNIMIL